jgi:predicted transcriptional regulator
MSVQLRPLQSWDIAEIWLSGSCNFFFIIVTARKGESVIHHTLSYINAYLYGSKIRHNKHPATPDINHKRSLKNRLIKSFVLGLNFLLKACVRYVLKRFCLLHQNYSAKWQHMILANLSLF